MREGCSWRDLSIAYQVQEKYRCKGGSVEETKNLQSTKFAFLLRSPGQKIVLDKHTVEEQYLIPRLDCKVGGCKSEVNSVGVKIHRKETTAPVFVPRIWKSCVMEKSFSIWWQLVAQMRKRASYSYLLTMVSGCRAAEWVQIYPHSAEEQRSLHFLFCLCYLLRRRDCSLRKFFRNCVLTWGLFLTSSACRNTPVTHKTRIFCMFY